MSCSAERNMFILFHFISHIYTQQTPSYTIVDLAKWVDVAQAHNSTSAINYFSSLLFFSLSHFIIVIILIYVPLSLPYFSLYFLHSATAPLVSFPLFLCSAVVLCSWNFLQFLQCWNLQQCRKNDVKARSRTHETHSLWSKAASEKLTAHKVAEELFFRAHLGFWQCLSMITHSATETRWVHLLSPPVSIPWAAQHTSICRISKIKHKRKSPTTLNRRFIFFHVVDAAAYRLTRSTAAPPEKK